MNLDDKQQRHLWCRCCLLLSPARTLLKREVIYSHWYGGPGQHGSFLLRLKNLTKITMTRSRGITTTLLLPLYVAIVGSLFLAGVHFAYAEESTSATGTVAVTPEKLEKDVKGFIGKGVDRSNKKAVAERIRQVERRIAELRMHLKRYEELLLRLKQTDSASSTKRLEQKDQLKEKASSTRSHQKRGDVLGVSTSTPPVPVIPVCRVTFGKGWYTFGQPMTVSWKTTGAKHVEFVIVPEAELKDALVLPSGPQSANGSITVPASILGVPTVALQAVSETGHTSFCTRSVTILASDTSVTDKRVVPLLNQLKQLGLAEQRLRDQQKKVEESLASTIIKMLQLQLQIERLNPGLITSDDDDVVSRESDITFGIDATSPDASTIVVPRSESIAQSVVMVMNLDVDGVASTPVNALFVKLTSSAPLVAVAKTVTLTVKGREYRATNVPAATAKTFVYKFDTTGLTLTEADGDLPAVVSVEFLSQEKSAGVARYANGTTIKAEVTAAERDRTDTDEGVTAFAGSAVGDTHRLIVSGLSLSEPRAEADVTTADASRTVGEFALSVEVTAIGDDYYIPMTTAYTMANKSVGMNYRIDGATGTMPARGASATLTSSADMSGNYFMIQEGETETLNLKVTYDPTVTGSYRLQGLQINYSATASTPNQSVLTLPYSGYRSASIVINQ